MKSFLVTAATALFLGVAGVSAMPVTGHPANSERATDCDRECMTTIVNQVLDSMVTKDPFSLPLASMYEATENSHPAALSMMTLWRTVTEADGPSLLAIDTTSGSAFFSLAISEGSDETQSVLQARIKVVDKQITELEFFVNRSRGDHGFSLSSEELAENFEDWMTLPEDREIATREVLENLSAATFDPSNNVSVSISDDCFLIEEGWKVVDPGPDYNRTTEQLRCQWPDDRPADLNARLNLVIDEVTGIILTAAIIPGMVYPYGNLSAFIPNDMVSAQEEQDEWLAAAQAEGGRILSTPKPANGEVFEVLQYYNGQLQGMQINVYLGGPEMESVWMQ